MEISTRTPSNGEFWYDSTKKTIVVGDGSTVGGVPLAKESAVPASPLQYSSQSLTKAQKGQALANLGVDGLHVMGGRLTVYPGAPVSPENSESPTLYYSPFKGNTVVLYDTVSSLWYPLAFSEISISLSGVSSGKTKDVFVYDNAGTLALELGSDWTNDTTRATALAYTDGVPHKSGDATRRYVGTIYAYTPGTVADAPHLRHLWNCYNRIPKAMLLKIATGSWAYTLATIRQANASATNQLDFVVGLDEDLVSADYLAISVNSGSNLRSCMVGLDSSTTKAADSVSGVAKVADTVQMTARYKGRPGVGRHTLKALEQSTAAGTCTWYGDLSDNTKFQAGMVGEVLC